MFQEKAAPPPAEQLAPGERLQPSKQQLAEHARREAEAGITAAADDDALGRVWVMHASSWLVPTPQQRVQPSQVQLATVASDNAD